MNIQNVVSLVDQLQSLGFKNSDSSLLKRICFKPENFILFQRIEKGKDQLRFYLFIERGSAQGSYALIYYDAILLREMALTDSVINGIDLSVLERKMAEIDWKIAFELDTSKHWNAEDKSTWEKELKIESVVSDLIALEISEEGRAIAINFKIKHWTGVSNQELLGNISPLKNRSEVSQRFYFTQGQVGISVDEAYRFLQNRWLEKQMQIKRKQLDSSIIGESGSDGSVSSGNGLPGRKRSGRTKAVKTKKIAQK